jgi:hypothetical protein
MNKEITALQIDMFTGELVDNRTPAQKKNDLELQRPRQMELFAAREVAQFGVNPRPLIDLSPTTRLTLWSEDPRTEDEIERDRQRAAEAATYKMLDMECRALIVRGIVALTIYQPPQPPFAMLGDTHEP